MFSSLYVMVFSSSAFVLLMYSLLSTTTSATPLSAVKMMWSLSDLSCLMAFHSSLVKLGLRGFDYLRILDISALSSSTSVGFRLWHATSIAIIYSL